MIEKKRKELLAQVRAKKDYIEIANEVDALNGEKHKMLFKKAMDEGIKRRIKEMEEFLNSQSMKITEYDEEFVRKYIMQIKICDDRFEMTFKSGVEIDVERK